MPSDFFRNEIFSEGILTEDERKVAQQERGKALTAEEEKELTASILAAKIPPVPKTVDIDKLVNKLANLTEDEVTALMIKTYGKLPKYDPTEDLDQQVEGLRNEQRLLKDLDFLNKYGSDPKEMLGKEQKDPKELMDQINEKFAQLRIDDADLAGGFVGKYDGKKLENDITGDTLEDVVTVMKERYNEHQRLILAALLYNSCTPGKTDFTVFTDLIQFRPGLTSRPHRAA